MNQQNRAGRAAERLMGLDSPSYGDERERAVVTEASTFGLTVGIFINLAVAFVTAVLGWLLLPTLLILLTAVPSWATIWYAGQRGVDLEELTSRVRARERLGTFAFVFGSILLVVAAMAWTVFTGEGLLQLPESSLTGPEASGLGASLVKGAVIGAFGGGVVGFVGLLVSNGRRRKRAPQADLHDDLD